MLLVVGAAVLGLVAGTCVGYLVQADREPTPLPSLSQATVAQAEGEGPEPLSAAQDRKVRTDGDLRKLLLRKPTGARPVAWLEGSPGPFAVGNVVGAHYADLRALVLPAPEGAREDKALRGSDGWLAAKDYLAEYQVKEERDELGQKLVDNGLRHIAARGWTTPDGTRTRVYLLQFDTANVVETAFAGDAVAFATPTYQIRGAAEVVYDEDFPQAAAVSHVVRTVYVEEKPYGPEQVRQAYLATGDVFAVILQSREGTAEAVPFQQTVILQSQLLG
ncbi:hypothetical protein [Streptomyces turgidiscabies]|uniref:Lipoprotein n=1 Tax=Streptomyces turgidiscabies TaxID=85558 RepID=A0ABU0RQT3_9ACTN|nr:hypothetical protein [Streptomyces turgidiscabies]MDQ0934344.1 hypothetical protein [Streptomyces turgidiscabies]